MKNLLTTLWGLTLICSLPCEVASGVLEYMTLRFLEQTYAGYEKESKSVLSFVSSEVRERLYRDFRLDVLPRLNETNFKSVFNVIVSGYERYKVGIEILKLVSKSHLAQKLFKLGLEEAHLKTLKLMKVWCGEKKYLELVEDGSVFTPAIVKGHLDAFEVVRHCVGIEAFQNVINKNIHSWIDSAALMNQFLLVNQLIEWINEDSLHQAVVEEDFSVFKSAAYSGNLQILERLGSLANEELAQVVKSSEFEMFRIALQKGDVDSFSLFCDWLNDYDALEEFLRENAYSMLYEAFEQSLDMFRFLIDFLDEEESKGAMLIVFDRVLHKTIHSGSVDQLELLQLTMTKDQLRDALEGFDYNHFVFFNCENDLFAFLKSWLFPPDITDLAYLIIGTLQEHEHPERFAYKFQLCFREELEKGLFDNQLFTMIKETLKLQ